ncbi:unnamed protein product [Brassica oleracea var. botrytis]
MGIPWICSWHFTLAISLQDMPYSLLREFRVKWLGKYNIDRCSLGNIQKYFQIVNKTKTAIQTISKSTHLLNPSQISQTNPNSQTHKRPTSSPTSSTTSSSSQKSSRKEKMKTFLAEMLAQFEAENSDIEESNQQVNDTQAEDPYGSVWIKKKLSIFKFCFNFLFQVYSSRLCTLFLYFFFYVLFSLCILPTK